MSETTNYIKKRLLTDGTLYPVLVPLNGSLPFRTAVKKLKLMPDQDYDVIPIKDLTDQEFREHRLHQLTLTRPQLNLYELWYFPLTPNDYGNAYMMAKTDKSLCYCIAAQAKASDLAVAAQTGDYRTTPIDTPYSY